MRRFLAIRPNDIARPVASFSPVDRMMRNMFRALGEFSSDMDYSGDEERAVAPRGDFYRKDGKVYAEFELPGIDPAKVELNVFEDRLTLKAEKADEKTLSEGDVFRCERYYGTLSRSIQFPAEVDPDSAKATFKNGVLTVEIAEKVQAEKMKKVTIEEES
ncbi:MAG: Hsp20/alpha crystallin family protein [Synergistaceae bacterium]|jgi:HSP20 family protein|nr:Hsp20/alpha crystallin family protein [Synergistaceae bacterium]